MRKPRIEVLDRHGHVIDTDVVPDGGRVHVPLMLRDGDEDLISSRSARRRRKVQQRDPEGREAGTYEEEEDSAMRIETDMAPMIVDAFGLTDGLSRPGSRHLHSGRKTLDEVTREVMRDEARRDGVADLCDAWKGGGSDRTIPVKRRTADAIADAWLDGVEDLVSAWSAGRSA
jgi:hypothetical protein